MIELTYETEQDQYGVYDSVALARELISDAARLLAPYVGACPGCHSHLLSLIANDEIEKICGKENMDGFSLSVHGDGPEKDAAERSHLRENKERVSATLAAWRENTGHVPTTRDERYVAKTDLEPARVR